MVKNIPGRSSGSNLSSLRALPVTGDVEAPSLFFGAELRKLRYEESLITRGKQIVVT